jgi:hypothetical protein
VPANNFNKSSFALRELRRDKGGKMAKKKDEEIVSAVMTKKAKIELLLRANKYLKESRRFAKKHLKRARKEGAA